MQKIITAFVIVLGSVQMAMGQVAPGIEWQNTIGGFGDDRLNYISQTTDGGYILGGFSSSAISGDKTENCNGLSDYWIVKTNSQGSILWQNTVGGNNFDNLFVSQQTFDGGFILAGSSESDSSGDKTENSNGYSDIWIVKVDSLGIIKWQNTIGGSADDGAFSVQQTVDGGYILGGNSESNISGDKTENSLGNYDFWIVKLDSTGNIFWQNTIGGSDVDLLFDIKQTNDGGYIAGGYSSSNISGDKTENSKGGTDCWLVKIDSSGTIQWQKTIGGNNNDQITSLAITDDGGYLLGASSSSNISGDKTENSNGGSDYWIIKTDSSGNIQWQNTIGGSNSDILYSIRKTSNSGYTLGGFSESDSSGDKTENSNGFSDFWVVKTDSLGAIQWQNTVGGSNYDWLRCMNQTSDGGYILGGYGWSNISGDKSENNWNNSIDIWIVKLYPDTITSINKIEQSTNNVQVFPNPFTNEITISLNYPNTPITLSLFDIMGKEILSQRITTSNHKLQTSSLAKGIYFLKLNVDGNVITKKVVKM